LVITGEHHDFFDPQPVEFRHHGPGFGAAAVLKCAVGQYLQFTAGFPAEEDRSFALALQGSDEVRQFLQTFLIQGPQVAEVFNEVELPLYPRLDAFAR
jgi:hypothetical protein